MKKIHTGERIKAIMEERNLKQVDILRMAKKFEHSGAKLTKSDLSLYVNGKVEPHQHKIHLLAKALDVNEAWLMGIDSPKHREAETPEILTVYNELHSERQDKVYDFAKGQLKEQLEASNVVHANFDTEIATEFITPHTVDIHGYLSAGSGAYNFDKEHFIDQVILDYDPPHHDLAFEVSGDSMRPIFKDGELVFIKKTTDVYDGNLIAVEINDEAFLKKVYFEESRMRLISLNSERDAEGERLHPDFFADENDDIYVIGKVIN